LNGVNYRDVGQNFLKYLEKIISKTHLVTCSVDNDYAMKSTYLNDVYVTLKIIKWYHIGIALMNDG